LEDFIASLGTTQHKVAVAIGVPPHPAAPVGVTSAVAT
jgi:hypothetical protein